MPKRRERPPAGAETSRKPRARSASSSRAPAASKAFEVSTNIGWLERLEKQAEKSLDTNALEDLLRIRNFLSQKEQIKQHLDTLYQDFWSSERNPGAVQESIQYIRDINREMSLGIATFSQRYIADSQVRPVLKPNISDYSAYFDLVHNSVQPFVSSELDPGNLFDQLQALRVN